MMKSPWRKSVLTASLPILLLCALVSYVIASEMAYAHLKRPDNITNVSDFYSRFGTSGGTRAISVNGFEHIEISGPLPPPWSLALPSSRPAYVFDETGRFVDWCSDPGDNPSWRSKWPTIAHSEMTHDDVRLRFGINE
jgi:hypothetical protein